MNLFKNISFTHENKNYEIRIMYEDDLINIATFYNNYPANGFRYQIKIPKGANVKNILTKYPVAELAEIAKKNIMEKRWDRLLKLNS